MEALRSQLAALDPPLKHQLESQGKNLVITLIDPARPAKVTRTLNESLVRNTPLLYDVIRDAVNELRAIGCHPPISEHEVFPDDASVASRLIHAPAATSDTWRMALAKGSTFVGRLRLIEATDLLAESA